jgi:uncharacterized membrane protein YfcA
MIAFEPWQWALAALAALIIGVAKAGIGGLGLLAVVIFAQILPAKQATGAVLPLLCVGDIVGAVVYWRHAKWEYIRRLMPWTAVGVAIGYVALDWLEEAQARVLIGGIIVGMVALHYLRRRGSAPALASIDPEALGHGPFWLAPAMGVLVGFTTLVANAAGPLMVIYMLAMRLPKLDFVGTGAVFFLLLNFFKVPFMVHLGLITTASFSVNLVLAPAVLAGTWVGRHIVLRIDQRVFENVALLLSLLAGVKLLV